ncbi:MAG: hypothetical protein ACI4QM_03860 [Alphaproteobacteria bacterium]
MSEEELNLYIRKEGLDRLIEFPEQVDFKVGVYDNVSGKIKIPFPPVKQDLVQLHKLIRENHFFTALEFGVGYSSIIICDALYKNQQDFERLNPQPDIRNRYKFQLFCVDSSFKWIWNIKKKIPPHLKNRLHISHSRLKIGTYQGQVCSYYKKLPDIVPDFIYLDGPDPQKVHGTLNGLSFRCWERTVVAADLLLMESTFLPGTCILVDGRTNNARFLQRHFTRNFKCTWNKELDTTLFQLDEERLGPYNILGKDLF